MTATKLSTSKCPKCLNKSYRLEGWKPAKGLDPSLQAYYCFTCYNLRYLSSK